MTNETRGERDDGVHAAPSEGGAGAHHHATQGADGVHEHATQGADGVHEHATQAADGVHEHATQGADGVHEHATQAAPGAQHADTAIAAEAVSVDATLAQAATEDLKAAQSRTTKVGEGDGGGDKTATGEDLESRILAQMAGHDAKSRPDPLIGKEIGGRFTVTSKIGEGGMGAVYKARQRGMDRDVAIKVLLKNLTEQDTVVRRFHLEALAVSKLRHPNTIQIFDFGETDEGQLYIAMEFLEGVSLYDELKDKGAIATRRALRMTLQVAKSLREAHAKGIVHRDLKPDNIFLSSVGEEPDYVKVLDFGVAKLREGDENQGTLTQAGTIFGTPKYMSPEQARAGEIDARSDLYAIGVILYEMLLGRLPFDGDNHLEVLIKHIQKAPPRFEDARPDLVVPGPVQDLAYRLLAKKADDRPQTAEALIKECEALLRDLDEIFRNVISRADADAVGFDRLNAKSTKFDTVFEGLASGATTVGAEALTTAIGAKAPSSRVPRRARSRAQRVAMIAVLALVAFGVTAGVGVFVGMKPLPASHTPFAALADVRVDPLPVVELAKTPPVTLLVNTTPPGAAVVVDGKPLKQVTPVMVRRPLNGTAKVEFQLDGYEPKAATLTFGEDGTQTVALVAVTKPKTKATPRTSGSGGTTKPKAGAKPVAGANIGSKAADPEAPKADVKAVYDSKKPQKIKALKRKQTPTPTKQKAKSVYDTKRRAGGAKKLPY